jgi:HlyD family secretion protein
LTVAARSLDAKRARLKGLSSVRPADVAVAEAQLRAANAVADEIRAAVENATVRAPFAGRVLELRAFPGQAVGGDGLLTMGRTAEMFVDAEVPEEELGRARVGQRVRITGAMLATPVAGTVEEIGLVVGNREVFRNDPTAFADARIVHVKIRAAEPAALERFINARVTAVIQP